MKREEIINLCHDLGLHEWDGGDEDGYGGEYDVDYVAVAKIEGLLTKHGIIVE